MTSRPTHIFVTLFAVFLLVIGGIVSAAMMAPGQADAARVEIAALGISAADICGDDPGIVHRCPFCHLVAEVSVPAPQTVVRHFVPSPGWQQHDDLYRDAQTRDPSRTTRGPPTLV